MVRMRPNQAAAGQLSSARLAGLHLHSSDWRCMRQAFAACSIAMSAPTRIPTLKPPAAPHAPSDRSAFWFVSEKHVVACNTKRDSK